MKNKRIGKTLLKTTILVTLIVTRIFLGLKMGTWFASNQYYDDALLAKYAIYGKYSSNNPLSLIKMMGFPWFLQLVSASHLSYPLVLSLVWVIVALLGMLFIRQFHKNKKLEYFVFLYFLFFPTAFEFHMGTRMYRNSLLTPFYFIVFLLILYIGIKIIHRDYKSIGFYLSNIFLGIMFTWTFFIKEDGQWLLVSLIFFSVLFVFIVLYQIFSYNRLRYFLLIPILCIPLSIFAVGDTMYLNYNQEEYGVRYIQTRTDGQLGQFVNRVYTIKSKDRNTVVWAPYDAIKKAFDASPTLQQYPKLLEKIENSPWVGENISKNPIYGDFLTWVLRDALVSADLWTNQEDVDKFFETVNKEIDDAFKEGKLIKDNSIQIIDSASGKTPREIVQLAPLVFNMYKGHIFLDGYRSGGAISEIYSKKLATRLSTFIHTPYLKDNKINGKKISYEPWNIIVKVLLIIYKIVNPILFTILMLSILLTTIDLIKNRQKLKRSIQLDIDRYYSYIMSIFLLGISIVYGLCIAWFVSFVYIRSEGIDKQIWLNFYSIGVPVLLSLCYIFGLRSFSVYLKRISRFISYKRRQKRMV